MTFDLKNTIIRLPKEIRRRMGNASAFKVKYKAGQWTLHSLLKG